MVKYKEGVCGDGAAILQDGKPMKVHEIVARLNGYHSLLKPLSMAIVESDNAEKKAAFIKLTDLLGEMNK